MTTRILSPAEWPKLQRTGMGQFLSFTTPTDTQIVVAEDGDRIVGCWAVVRVTHLEGVWIDPAYRKRGRVARVLLSSTLALARQFGCWAMTGAQTDEVRRLITKHLRGEKIDMDTYVVPLEAR